MSNAEHQAAWRARRQAELDELREIVYAPPGVGRVFIDSTMSMDEICEALNDVGHFSPIGTATEAGSLDDDSRSRLLAAAILHYGTSAPKPEGFYDPRPPYGLTTEERAAWDAERAAEKARADEHAALRVAQAAWRAANPEKWKVVDAWIAAHLDATQEDFDAWCAENGYTLPQGWRDATVPDESTTVTA